MRALFCLLAIPAASLLAADLPKITFSKDFPGSQPPYFEITIDRNGTGLYKEAPNDENPLAVRLAPAEASEIFGLADKLDHFSKPLESSLKVAFLGTKILRWESGSEKHEVKFNYSLDVAAQQITDWFERIGESEIRYVVLERAAKFDRLGINDALLMLEIAYDNKRLVAKTQFLPLLDRVAKNEKFMHMARERAAKLAEAFRAEAP